MLVNGGVLAGVGCAAFVGGILLCAVVLILCLHMRRPVPQGQHNASSSLASTPNSVVLPHPPTMGFLWLPQPAGFNLNESNIMATSDAGVIATRCTQLQWKISSFSSKAKWKELPAKTLRALANDSFATVLTQHNYGYTPIPSHTSSLPPPISSSSNSPSIPIWSAVADLFCRPETRKSALTHLLSCLVCSNTSLDGSGPAEWNLLSPHLAGLAQEIAELQKIRKEPPGSFSVWSWEKLRVYAVNILYPSIFVTPVVFHQDQQPTTQPHAISRLEKLLVDLLAPYIEITDKEIKELQYILRTAGQLSVFAHKDLQPWSWSWETEREGIPLFPAFEIVGSTSGIRDPSKKALRMVELVIDPKYNMAGEFLGTREGQDSLHG